VDRLHDRIRRSGGASGWTIEALARRLDHFVREDARTAGAADAFAGVDRDSLEVLSDASQEDAEHLLGNQVPETIALARQARELGAFGACSFGAGFGGSVWALVEREHAADLARRWHPSAFVADPGPRLVELNAEG
jgi:galactokinase